MRPTISLLAGLLVTSSAFAGEICIIDSPSGNNVTVDCSASPLAWANSHVGYSTDGVPCEVGFFCGFEPSRGFNNYRWTLSSSAVDPHLNTGPLASPIAEVWLWLECTSFDGMAAAEFSIESTEFLHLATTMLPGFLNAGTTSDLLMAVGGCPTAPVPVALLLFLNLGPVSVETQSWAGIKSMYR